MNIFSDIEDELFALRDEKYAELEHKIAPTLEKEHFIGVRTPELRKLAKVFAKKSDTVKFLKKLPHQYFEEDQLHAFIVCEEKDFLRCINMTNAFLPFVDNWATCDQFSPKIFAKHADELLPYIDDWLNSTHTYTIRYAIGMLMRYFLGNKFKAEYAERVARISSDEYYVNMMRAWYFATALAKNYSDILPYIEQNKLDIWTHNKTIQKAAESFRITSEQKQYLRTLRK